MEGRMSENGNSAGWIGTFGAIVAALIAAAATLAPRFKNHPHPTAGSAVMGPLEPGVNRQGMDFDAYGSSAPNAQLCPEACRTNGDCKAMTYVVSLKTCWLKKGVPGPAAPGGADYVSALKQP
jgi:hypothetical protein